MTYYRLYFLDGRSGPICDFRELEVADDAAAVAAAERLRRMGAMELWCRGRKVRHWEPVGSGRNLMPRYGDPGSSRLASP